MGLTDASRRDAPQRFATHHNATFNFYPSGTMGQCRVISAVARRCATPLVASLHVASQRNVQLLPIRDDGPMQGYFIRAALRSAPRRAASHRITTQRNVPFNHLEYDRCT